MQYQWKNDSHLEINNSSTLNLVLFLPSWHMQHTTSGILFNFCSNYMMRFKMLMQKVYNVYTVFDILSNSILRAQSLKCWETSSIKRVTIPLGKYTYQTISEIAWVKWALLAIYAVRQQTDFPRVHAKSIGKMELQTRSPWLLFFCSVEYRSVPLTLEIILFLDFSLQDAR